MSNQDFNKQIQLMKNIEDILDYTFKLANIFENEKTLNSFFQTQKLTAGFHNFYYYYEYFKY